MKELQKHPELFLNELKSTLILQNLSLEELRSLAGKCSLWEYDAGEAIVTEDSLSQDLYILLSGSVDIIVKGKEKDKIHLSSLERGEVIGEASIFLDVRRTASVIAHSTLRIVSISRDRIFEFCNEHPKAGLKIFTFIIYSLLRKLSAMNREMAVERESIVTQEDLEILKGLFPKSVDEMLKA